MTAVPVYGAEGALESALVVVRDITERTNAARLLAQHAGQQECVARLGQFALRERDPRLLLDHVLAAVAHTLELEFCIVLALRPGGDTLDIVGETGSASSPRDPVPRRQRVPPRERETAPRRVLGEAAPARCATMPGARSR